MHTDMAIVKNSAGKIIPAHLRLEMILSVDYSPHRADIAKSFAATKRKNMHNLPFLFLTGFAGALFFRLLKLPGGAMTGAMITVVAFTALSDRTPAEVPSWLTFIVYSCVGVIIGSMYKPGMLKVIGASWPILVLSTALILLAGCACAWIVARSGTLSSDGAYLATTPGGFNAVMGLALTNAEAPIIMVYHLFRIYFVTLLAPYIVRLLGILLK